MITVYGSPLCKDCLAMKIIFEQLNVDYQYVNITGKSVVGRNCTRCRR